MRRIRPAVLFAWLGCTGLLAAFLFLHSAYFRVREIRVTGHAVLDARHVAGLTGVRIGDNLWELSPRRLSSRLLQDPWIERAVVRRQWPGTLRVEIAERAVAAAVPYYRRFLALDRQGVALGVVDQIARLDAPVITGPPALDLVLGRVHPAPEVSRALLALDLLGPELARAVAEVHLGAAGEMTIYLSGGTRVEVGQDGDLERKVTDLRAILADLRNRRLTVEYVDLRYEGQPVVKLRE